MSIEDYGIANLEGVAVMPMITPRPCAVMWRAASVDVMNCVGGFGTACSAIEGMMRTLAAEVGPKGVRVCWLRSAGPG